MINNIIRVVLVGCLYGECEICQEAVCLLADMILHNVLLLPCTKMWVA